MQGSNSLKSTKRQNHRTIYWISIIRCKIKNKNILISFGFKFPNLHEIEITFFVGWVSYQILIIWIKEKVMNRFSNLLLMKQNLVFYDFWLENSFTSYSKFFSFWQMIWSLKLRERQNLLLFDECLILYLIMYLDKTLFWIKPTLFLY